MNAISATYQQLAVALTADPLLLLAATVATFDPFWSAFDESDIDYETDPFTTALQVTRGAFPDIYAQAVERLRAGASYQEVDWLLCKAISAKGIPLDDLETIGWGIPLHAVGVDLEDPAFYAVHSDLLPLLVPFGISLPEGEVYSVDIPDAVYSAGRAIVASLTDQTEPALRQAGWAFAWIFSCTGNSLIDQTNESLADIPPLSWSAEDVAFAIELIEEADGILRDVQAGIDYLKQSLDLRAALERNGASLYRELKQKGKLNEWKTRLCWTSALSGADGIAVADPFVLQLRRDAA
ncbi:MAG: hypothetical protein JNJ61_30535 [Anaerolineae bacterium]|nr:hypothetical protein [Anaerolineae bacterium]